MSQYIAIAAIRIEHNYYNPPENSFVGLEPTPDTKKLMRQRGVMLRQSRGNEWQWIMADDASGFADKDVLELSMIVKDPCFLQQIESDGYDCSYEQLLLGGASIDVHGVPLTDETVAKAKACDAVLMGSIGGDAKTSPWYKLEPSKRPEAGLLKI